MSRQFLGPVDLGTLEPLVVGAGLVSALLWFAGAAFVFASRAPPRPPLGPRTLVLGPEPPAVANLLVNDLRVTNEAVPATLLDLAARRVVEIEQRGLGSFYVRLRSQATHALTGYERQVLGHLARLAREDVVPVQALTTGEGPDSRRWWSAFRKEVVLDAQARGLSRDALDGRELVVLGIAAAIPAACFWAAWGLVAAAAVLACAAVLLGWTRARYPQRETPAGLEAASRWHGVRAELASNEELNRHSPLTVVLWDRLLAYGAALGVASGAARSLPLGIESDTRAWSSHGGEWREIRVRYPRNWPPAWGTDPATACLRGLAIVAVSVLALGALQRPVVDAGLVSAAVAVALALTLLLGGAVVALGAADWRAAVEITGPILRRRRFGAGGNVRYYIAVDDAVSTRINAFRVSRAQYDTVEQGDVVTVRTTPRLGRVRWIIPASGAA